VKTFFKRSAEWELVASGQKPKAEILERCVFKHRTRNVYLIADAYRGIQIRQTIVDFLSAAAGSNPEKVTIKTGLKTMVLTAGGGANLVVYVGHDGLMDFQLATLPQKANDVPREAIILACASKAYFAGALRAAGAQPLLWTTNLMAPEAYTLKAAIDGWLLKETNAQIRERAAAAYDKYQKCGINGARKLMATGW
jgi:hypothetical protein